MPEPGLGSGGDISVDKVSGRSGSHRVTEVVSSDSSARTDSERGSVGKPSNGTGPSASRVGATAVESSPRTTSSALFPVPEAAVAAKPTPTPATAVSVAHVGPQPPVVRVDLSSPVAAPVVLSTPMLPSVVPSTKSAAILSDGRGDAVPALVPSSSSGVSIGAHAAVGAVNPIVVGTSTAPVATSTTVTATSIPAATAPTTTATAPSTATTAPTTAPLPVLRSFVCRR